MSEETARQHPRFAIEVDVILETPTGPASGRTRNLSRGGFCAVVTGNVTAGDTVSVLVSLVFTDDAVSEPLALPAKICWSTPIGGGKRQVGASFAAIPADDASYLEMFLRYLEESSQRGNDTVESDPDDPFSG